MRVPYFDLKTQYQGIRDEVRAALDRACSDASFVLGDEVAAFEREFAAACGTRHCVALTSGTRALHLPLLAAGAGPCAAVVPTANTVIATAEAIAATRATPVFVELAPATANIDPRGVEAALTPRTRATRPVHLYGRPADLEPILKSG